MYRRRSYRGRGRRRGRSYRTVKVGLGGVRF